MGWGRRADKVMGGSKKAHCKWRQPQVIPGGAAERDSQLPYTPMMSVLICQPLTTGPKVGARRCMSARAALGAADRAALAGAGREVQLSGYDTAWGAQEGRRGVAKCLGCV